MKEADSCLSCPTCARPLPPRTPYFNAWLFLWAPLCGGLWGTIGGLALTPFRHKDPLWGGWEVYAGVSWLAWFVGVNAVAFAAYGYDKFAAVTGWRRIRENTLIWFSALGAIPGDALARSAWNHKHHDEVFLYRAKFVGGAAAIAYLIALGSCGWQGVLGLLERVAWALY